MSAPAAPPPSGAYPFIFTDESGVVWNSPTEPFYGIGMLKVSDAGRWTDALNLHLDRLISAAEYHARKQRAAKVAAGIAVPPRVALPRQAYEFKFAEITTHTRKFYEALVDYFIAQPDGYFSAFVIDKRTTGVDPIAVCGSSWDALITYTITLLRQRIAVGEKAIIISDNYQKPRKHPHYFERQVVHALGERAVNAVMIDSGASVMLQLVDVLLGCVMYHYKLATLPHIDADKKFIADRLATAYGLHSLRGSLTRTTPNFLDVWRFTPRARHVPLVSPIPKPGAGGSPSP